MPVSQNFTMKRGVFNRTILFVGIKRTLGASFTIRLAIPRFHNVTTSLVEKKFKRSTQDLLWLVVTLGESENGHDDRETSTQDALHPAAQLCSMKEPTFHCRIFSYGHLYDLHILKSMMLYDKWSLFIVKQADPDRAKDAQRRACVTQLICIILPNERRSLSI
ncbi:predicted protein [Lichtheimia corymbifera JMRC:FSU:9682]|uniref:Uncharacterized protein n=1 Tax=Lichtheimia corymbifera JMRC:FSU:9682 TaxID=1263082 RepID=A0A068RSW4_9FUNG|nr:predicted protein [Lichtheimia corymbifera JMRC:FSU:9682]